MYEEILDVSKSREIYKMFVHRELELTVTYLLSILLHLFNGWASFLY